MKVNLVFVIGVLFMLLLSGCPLQGADEGGNGEGSAEERAGEDKKFVAPPIEGLEQVCGDGVVDEGENCLTCSQDAGCGGHEVCEEGTCVLEEYCGDGIVNNEENCSSCPKDARCEGDYICVEGNCVEKSEIANDAQKQADTKVPQVLLRMAGEEWYISEGEGIYVDGEGEYDGEDFFVKLERIGERGWLEYEATFVLLGENGDQIDRERFYDKDQLYFYDSEDREVEFADVLEVKQIQIPR